MASFTETILTRTDGESIGLVTHMEIGPDGLLYTSSFDGRITAYSIADDGNGGYEATVVHEIFDILSVPNHNDDGTPVSLGYRAVMGFDVVGTPTDPKILVTSNDPRIDTFADTNSGTLHEITLDGNGNWQMVDLVRGIPRSQHDHLTNGVEYVIDSNGNEKAYISVGGNTNAGAPSNPLQYVGEYALSGAVLEVDLAAVKAEGLKTDAYGREYYYNLPTLNDPERPGVNEGVDASIEIYGGNFGLNQAKLIDGGPVSLYASGVRNATEILETENGNLFLFDNGGNPSWGGDPVVVNGDATNLPTSGNIVTSNLDQLHLITEGAYLGHPNPTRASGSNAGIYEQDASGTLVSTLPSDYDDVVYQTDPQQGIFLAEGTADGAIALSSKSTNGFAEYTFAGAFDGDLVGDLFAVRYGVNAMIRVELTDVNGDGIPESGSTVEQYALGAGQPIDVLAPKAGEPLHGFLLYSALIEDGSIRILEPDDGSVNPPTETDRDGDGIEDIDDPLQYDANNGFNTDVTEGQTLFWDFESTMPASELPGGISGFAIGITGFMSNGTNTPEELSIDRFDPVVLGGDDVVLGGTANTILIGATPDGTAEGASNDQYHGFQAGFDPASDTFRVEAQVLNQFGFIAPGDQSTQQKMGLYLGDGTQENYVSLVIGLDFMELRYEESGVEVLKQTINNSSLSNVDENVLLTDLYFDVDKTTGILTASFRADTLDGEVTGSFAPITLFGNALDAVQGARVISGEPTSVVWGLMATSGSATPFQANYMQVKVVGGELAPDPDDIVAAINVGGEQYASVSENILFSADPGPDGGSSQQRDVSADVAGTQDDRLYQTYRFGEFEYDIDNLDPGEYRVDIYLAEPFFNGANSRVFDVSLEGSVPAGFNDIDIAGLTGGTWTSRIITETVTVTDGTLDIDMVAGTNSPLINAFVVSEISTTPASTGEVVVDAAGSTSANGGFFTVTNTGDLDITQLTFTIADTLIPDLFFDTDGTGDAGNPIPFTVDNAGGTGVTNGDGVTINPLPNGGYSTLVIDFTDFNPGESFTFHIDVDPESAQGFGAGSPQGAISGLELTGTLLTADFSDGSSSSGEFFGTGIVASRAVAGGPLAGPVTMNLGGITNGGNGFVPTTSQTLNLSGPPGATVGIVVVNGDVLPDDASGIGLLPQFGANAVQGGSILSTTLDGSGQGSIQIDLTGEDPTDPNDGVYKIMSAVLDANGDPAGVVGSAISVIVDDTPPSSDLQVFLIDATTDQRLLEITEGAVIDPAIFSANEFSIEVVPLASLGAESVQLDLAGVITKKENIEPYALFGDAGTDFFGQAVPDGAQTFTATAFSGNNLSGTQLAQVTLNFEFSDGSGGNDPVAGDDTATVAEDNSVLVDVLDNDTAGSTIQSVGTPTNGTAVIENGEIRYTPGLNFFGQATFTYQILGTLGGTDTGTVTVDVTPVNDDPENVALVGNTIVETAAVGAVVGDVSAFDPDGDELIFSSNDSRFEINGSDQLVLAAGADLTGLAGQVIPVLITADDQNGGSAAASFDVSVTDPSSSPDFEFWLIDATTDLRLLQLTDGAVVDTSIFNAGQFSIEVVTDPSIGAESVQLDLAGVNTRTENSVPYALFGDAGSDFFGQAVPIGAQTFTATAFSGNNLSGTQVGTDSVNFEFTTDPGNPSLFEAHFNVANQQVTANDGTVFLAGPGVSAGNIVLRNKSLAINGTQDDDLYDAYGFGQNFTFSINVPRAGTYDVDFLLAEVFHTSAGARVFDILLEGQQFAALDDIDIFTEAGGNLQATTLSQSVDVNDGTLDIQVVGSVDNALINAFSVFEQGTIA